MSVLPTIAFASILVSAAAAILILLSRKHPNVRETWTLLASVLKFCLIASLYPAVARGETIVFTFFELFPETPLFLKVDALGFYFALLASGLWVITSIYNIGYMRSLKEHAQTRYYFSFALSLSSTVGIAFAGDLVTFFIFYELLTIATYPLVAHKESREAILAGRKYLVYSLSAGVALLFAIAMIYHVTGTIAFRPGGFIESALPARAFVPLFFLCIYGCAVKGALFPVHAWLPSAMVAPTPVSALLHAVAVVKAGVFGILRITGYVFGPETMDRLGVADPLAWLAAFTIIASSCIALAQDNLKRRLAYSTISQLSYIILGAALLNGTAYFGSVLHLANHAFMKITLFFCAGAIYACSHIENISEMRGLGRRLPWTFLAFAIAAFGISGFPPFNGFISKWYLFKGAYAAQGWTFSSVYILSSLLNMAYFFPVLVTAFLPGAPSRPIREGPVPLIAPPVITAVLTLLFGAVPFFLFHQFSLARNVAAQVFGG